MNESYTIQIVTPSGEVFSKEGITFAKLPGFSGEIGVLPNHSHTVAQLIPGEMILKQDETESCFFISKGIAHITHRSVILFSSYVEAKHEIDSDRARKAKERASKYLQSKDRSIDKDRARHALNRAESRLEIKKLGV